MGKQLTVFVSQNDLLVARMFHEEGYEIIEDPLKADFVVFTGGADVNPFLYGERALKQTHYSLQRDNEDIKLWKSVSLMTPKIGICRGSQFGNVMSGGSLWQDVDNHAGGKHFIKDVYFGDYKTLLSATSTHHQMSILSPDALLLAVANKATKKEAEGKMQTYNATTAWNNWTDVEAFYYGNTNFLGVQFHPEYAGAEICRKYFFRLFESTYDYKMEKKSDDKSLSNMQQVVTPF